MHSFLDWVVAVGFSMALLFAADTGAAHEKTWSEYYDGMYGCRLNFPRELFSSVTTRPNEAKRFTIPHQNTFFQILGVANRPDWTAFDIRRKFLGDVMPGVVIYQHTSNKSVTLFGYRGDTTFHTKVILSDDLGTACILDISYPLHRGNTYRALAKRMLLSLHVREANN